MKINSGARSAIPIVAPRRSTTRFEVFCGQRHDVGFKPGLSRHLSTVSCERGKHTGRPDPACAESAKFRRLLNLDNGTSLYDDFV
jgi:hypothetical protein